MANQKLVAKSYCYAFISVYFFFLAYLGFVSFLKSLGKEISESATPIAVNSTITAISSFSSISISAVVVIIIVMAIIFSIISSFSMRRAFA